MYEYSHIVRMITKIGIRITLFWEVLLLLILAPDSRAEKIRFGTPSETNVHHGLLLTVAEQQGFWKEEGLEVDWVAFRSGARMVQVTVAGHLNMATSAPTEVIIATVQGAPLLIVADMHAPQRWSIGVSPQSPIKGPRDLKGARIGVVQLGGSAYAYARMVMATLNLEKEVRFVGTGGIQQSVAALKAGSVEAITHTTSTAIVLKSRRQVREVLDMTEFFPKPWIHMVVYAHQDFADRQERAIKGAIRVLLKAGAFVMANRQLVIPIMVKIAGYSESIAKEYFPEIIYGSKADIDVKGLQNVLDFMVNYNLIAKERAPAVQKLYTNRFLE